eukprot:2685361-Rhodomonas_salina.1
MRYVSTGQPTSKVAPYTTSVPDIANDAKEKTGSPDGSTWATRAIFRVSGEISAETLNSGRPSRLSAECDSMRETPPSNAFETHLISRGVPAPTLSGPRRSTSPPLAHTPPEPDSSTVGVGTSQRVALHPTQGPDIVQSKLHHRKSKTNDRARGTNGPEHEVIALAAGCSPQLRQQCWLQCPSRDAACAPDGPMSAHVRTEEQKEKTRRERVGSTAGGEEGSEDDEASKHLRAHWMRWERRQRETRAAASRASERARLTRGRSSSRARTRARPCTCSGATPQGCTLAAGTRRSTRP